MDEEIISTQKKMRLLHTTTNEQQDRLSNLPDELIHHILWFSNTKSPVQTSVLSKRWKLIWTTLPFLNFCASSATDVNYIRNFLANRNDESEVLKLNLTFSMRPSLSIADNVINQALSHAISHNVQELNVDMSWYEYDEVILSAFSSSTIKKLTLSLFYDEESIVSSECWEMPVLKTLHLVRPFFDGFVMLPESYLVCLPCLQTLLLDGFELPKCIILPGLTTLVLYDVEFSDNVSEFFHTLVNLRNLTLLFRRGVCADFVVNCPKLVKLEIMNYTCPMTMISDSGKNSKVMVLAPNIRYFSSVNFCPVTFGVAKLEMVNIKIEEFEDGTQIQTVVASKEIKKYCRLINDMFWGLSGAKILTLDLNTIEALSALSNSLVHSPPPFYNLEYVKVPHGFNESSMPTNLRSYLLGCSPKATIVTTLPQRSKRARSSQAADVEPASSEGNLPEFLQHRPVPIAAAEWSKKTITPRDQKNVVESSYDLQIESMATQAIATVNAYTQAALHNLCGVRKNLTISERDRDRYMVDSKANFERFRAVELELAEEKEKNRRLQIEISQGKEEMIKEYLASPAFSELLDAEYDTRTCWKRVIAEVGEVHPEVTLKAFPVPKLPGVADSPADGSPTEGSPADGSTAHSPSPPPVNPFHQKADSPLAPL